MLGLTAAVAQPAGDAATSADAPPEQAVPSEPADDPTAEAAPDSTPPPDAAQRLRDARTTYLLGRFDEARDALQRLIAEHEAGGSVPDAVWAEALVYLGELLYQGGDRPGAEAAFRLVLVAQPDWRISAYDHPMEVVGLFEIVRESVIAERRATPRPRYPWWGFAPLGVPQFQQGQVARGAVAATLQLVFAGASVGAWVAIDRSVANEPPGGDYATARALKFGLSLPAAGAFYVTWGASVADGAVTWRKRAGPTLAVLPHPTRPGVQVVGTF